MVQQATICESCGERVANTRCTNPTWRDYELCDLCAAEFNCDPHASHFVSLADFVSGTEPTPDDRAYGLQHPGASHVHRHDPRESSSR